MKSSSSTVDVGFVARAHGIKGAVRIRSTSDAIGAAKTMLLDDELYRVVRAQRDKEDWLVTLDGVVDRTAAEALRGKKVRVEREAITVADDELLVAELVGCTVVDVAGQILGEVTGSFDSSAHEVLEVRAADGREFMLPFVAGIVTDVDLVARRIVCDPPPGLVNLDEAD